MRILAIDTALDLCSACVATDVPDALLAQETLVLARGHAEALLPLVERVMARIEGGFESLTRVAVTVGPGSYTGLRVGLSAARAVGLAAAVPVVGVTETQPAGTTYQSWMLAQLDALDAALSASQ